MYAILIEINKIFLNNYLLKKDLTDFNKYRSKDLHSILWEYVENEPKNHNTKRIIAFYN